MLRTYLIGVGSVFAVLCFSCDQKATQKEGPQRKRDVEAKSSDGSAKDGEDDSAHDHPIYEKSLGEKKKHAKDPSPDADGPSTGGEEPVSPAPAASPVVGTPVPAPNPPPSPPPPATTPPPPPPPAPTEQMKLKAMYDAKKMISTVTIDSANPLLDSTSNAVKWFTSTAKPITCFAAVDAAGALIVPEGVNLKQIAAGTTAAPENSKFMANNAEVATLHSACQICNNTGASLHLHSGNGAPFSHGASAFATGTCVQFLVERLVAGVGQTYDHVTGSAANPVLFKIVKIGPDGAVVP
jgi:hypothetical protein